MIVASVAIHVLGLGVFGVIKIVETISPPPEFVAAPVEAIKPPPPPPPPPPSTKRATRSLPRPQPLVAQNPRNLSLPAIEMNQSDLTIGGGRGFGGGLGDLGGAVADSIRISFFGRELAEAQDMMFIVDISGSMVQYERGVDGYKTVVQELVKTLDMIKGVGSFNIIAFGLKADLYAREFMEATDDSINEAKRWLRKQDPANALKRGADPHDRNTWREYRDGLHSGTRTDLALKLAFEQKPRVIILPSDGEPSVSRGEIYAMVNKLRPH